MMTGEIIVTVRTSNIGTTMTIGVASITASGDIIRNSIILSKREGQSTSEEDINLLPDIMITIAITTGDEMQHETTIKD